jgi:hypothetical protein
MGKEKGASWLVGVVYRVRLVGSRCWCLGEDEIECEISLKSEELSWRMFVGEQLFFCGNC